MEPFYQLDTEKIRSAIEAQDLKHYWVAEQAGIHKTTLRRWLNHRIAKVRAHNIAKLAQVLEDDWRRLVIHSSCRAPRAQLTSSHL